MLAMNREVAVVVGVLCSATVAFADEATARKLFDSGERAYNLGEFDKAVDLFKQAYEQWPEPAFLFNIAQTFRQIGDCKQALFFYKRFLALKERDTKKPLRPQLKEEVDKRIVELEECMRRELANKPPTQLENGASTTSTTTTTTPANATAGPKTAAKPEAEPVDEPEEEAAPETPASTAPSLLSVRAIGGASRLSAGNLNKTFRFSGAITGGYPLSVADPFSVELGATLSFLPVPYTTMADEKGSGALFGILANVAPTYEIIPNLSARADLGVGVLVFSGLDKDGNPFTEGGAPATGALSTLHVRAAVSGDYAIGQNLVVTATPFAFAYSPSPKGFASRVSSLSTLSFLVGVGYRR